LKALKKEFISLSEVHNLNEVRLLKALGKYQDIIQLYDVIFERNQEILVLEYMEKNYLNFLRKIRLMKKQVFF
jgi:serine/threonine protein kinase